MASSGDNRSDDVNKSLVSSCKQLLKPLTKDNILFHYAPLVGAVSYTALSVNVMNPGLAIQIFPKRDLTNLLLAETLIGTGLYIYNRPHLRKSRSSHRLGYSVYGAVLFSFGSVLTWAVLRSALPSNVAVCTTFGALSSLALIKFGTNYMDTIDAQIPAK